MMNVWIFLANRNEFIFIFYFIHIILEWGTKDSFEHDLFLFAAVVVAAGIVTHRTRMSLLVKTVSRASMMDGSSVQTPSKSTRNRSAE